MNILAFDATLGAVSVAVGCDMSRPGRRSVLSFELRQAGHAEALLPMIARTMNEAGLGFDALDRIAVTIGPGTFTGARIGVATARALKLATGAELVGIPNLAVMAETAFSRLASELGESEALIAVDARRGEVYTQLFGPSALDAATPPLLLTVDGAARLDAGPLVVAGSGAEAVAEAARSFGRSVVLCDPALEPDAAALLELAPRIAPVAGALRPLYLRPPDARPQDGRILARAS